MCSYYISIYEQCPAFVIKMTDAVSLGFFPWVLLFFQYHTCVYIHSDLFNRENIFEMHNCVTYTCIGVAGEQVCDGVHRGVYFLSYELKATSKVRHNDCLTHVVYTLQ